MPALPNDIAKFTTDGVVITSPAVPAVGEAIKAAHIDAEDGDGSEIEMFYDSAADAQIMLDEKFVLRSKINPLHAGIEVEETLGIGVIIPISPVVPSFRCIDDSSEIDRVARLRAFAYETGSDRYSIEVIE